MPSSILEVTEATVSQLPRETPKPQKPITEPKMKNPKESNITLYLSQVIYIERSRKV